MNIGAIKFLPLKKKERVVIAELADEPGLAEILVVSDSEGDFVPLQDMFGLRAIRVAQETAQNDVARYYPGLPYSTVKISHKSMKQEDAYSLIMGKRVEIPPDSALCKRKYQYLYIDAAPQEKSRIDKFYQEMFAGTLWDGTERVFIGEP